MTIVDTCPLYAEDKPTAGYFRHRRLGEPACEQCKRSYLGRNYEGRSRNGRKPWKRAPQTKRCPHCGAMFTTKQRATYCSKSCGKRAGAGWPKPSPCTDIVHVPTEPERRLTPSLPVVVQSSGGLFVSGCCAGCGAPFTAWTTTGIARFCSRRCGRSYGKDKRRAVKRGAYVADVHRKRIFERDGWRCQLCGKAVRRNASAPHPLAPTIDHIIPLAQGGTHEPTNVQCAHFLCNSRKGDRAASDQLRLIG